MARTDQEIRLTIGMPVFNGERYLAAALGALMDQTFRDFELIISDNASTDRTAEICRAFAAADARIRYHRFDENIGAAGNYNKTLELARGEYFKWAAHDDVCAPEFLQRCIEVLDSEKDTVLCHSRSVAIDENGNTLGRYAAECAFDAATPQERFWRVISIPHLCIAIFGVMRTRQLRNTPMHGAYVGADRNLLAELALIGKIRLLPAVLFSRRDHAEASISKFKDEQERLAWFDPKYQGVISFPTWRRLLEYAASIRRVPLTGRVKLRCYLKLMRWLTARHHTGPIIGGMLLRELLRGLRQWLMNSFQILRGARASNSGQ